MSTSGMHNGSLFEQLLKRHDVKHILALSQRAESKVQRSRFFKKGKKEKKVRTETETETETERRVISPIGC